MVVVSDNPHWLRRWDFNCDHIDWWASTSQLGFVFLYTLPASSTCFHCPTLCLLTSHCSFPKHSLSLSCQYFTWNSVFLLQCLFNFHTFPEHYKHQVKMFSEYQIVPIICPMQFDTLKNKLNFTFHKCAMPSILAVISCRQPQKDLGPWSLVIFFLLLFWDLKNLHFQRSPVSWIVFLSGFSHKSSTGYLKRCRGYWRHGSVV
jgi:hypothetical protein